MAISTTYFTANDSDGVEKKFGATTETVSGNQVLVPTRTMDPGTAAGSLGKAEDAAHASGDVGVAVLARRKDSPAVSSGTDGDYSTVDVSAEGAVWSTLAATTAGGCSVFRTIDLDETEEEVKATAGQVYGYYFYNAANALRYLKIYNGTAASVTVGTTTPVLTLPLPATSAGHISFPVPVAFSTAICVAATTGLADNDTGAPSANDVILNVFYK